MSNFKLYSQHELNEMAYEDFKKEIHSCVLNFEHIIDIKTGSVPFNESNIELLIESITELKKESKNYTPYFGGNDMGLEYDFSDCVWEEILNCWGK
jgi:hypothetical protein